MNTTNSKTDKMHCLIFLFFLSFIFSTCNPQVTSELTIKSVEQCDNFDGDVNCTEPKRANDIIKLKPTSNGKEKLNWENFSNYLYFTARETPGFVITFSRPLTEVEKKSYSSGYVAYLSLDGVREKMEGFDLAKDKLASFHYLGSLLKEVKRKEKREHSKPDLSKDGNLLLQFEFTLPNGINQSVQREVKLEWAD